MKLGRAIGGVLLSFVFLSLFGGMIFGVQYAYIKYSKNFSKEAFLGSVLNGLQNVAPQDVNETTIQPAINLVVNAESAISVESNLRDINKIIFQKDISTQLPIASLTKLMTAVIVLDNYNLSDTVVVDNVADSQSAINRDVKLGDVMPVESFLDIMLVESSNKSAYALSELAGEQKFVDMMNQKAKDLGLKNTFFVDPTGLSSGNVSTVADLTILAEYILKSYPKIAEISKTKEFFVTGFGDISNTDELLGEIPDIICSKTGFTVAAKGCLLLVMNNVKDNNYLISIVLGADDRFSEMKNLVNWSSAICK